MSLEFIRPKRVNRIPSRDPNPLVPLSFVLATPRICVMPISQDVLGAVVLSSPPFLAPERLTHERLRLCLRALYSPEEDDAGAAEGGFLRDPYFLDLGACYGYRIASSTKP